MSAEATDRWLLTPRKFWLTTGTTALLTAGIIFTMGVTTQICLFVLCSLLIVPIGAVVLASKLLLSRGKSFSQRLMLLTSHCVTFLWVVTLQFLGLIGGIWLDNHQSCAAREWCDSLAPGLEAWRSEHGEYPTGLDQLGIELDPPRYCRSGLLYRARPNGYVLDFPDDGWLSGWCYSSDRGEWAHYD